MKNEQKKKILLIGHSSKLAGGGEDEFERLLNYFSNQKEKYEVHGLFPDGPRAPVFSKYCNRFGFYPQGHFPVTFMSIRDYLQFFRLYLRQKPPITKFIEEENYDVCIINVVVLIWPALFLRKKTKIILFIRETIEPNIFRKYIYKFLSKFVSNFITVSDTNKKDYIAKTGKENITVLYSAIEENIKFSDKLPFNQFISEKGVNDILASDRFKLVCVGALYERKNQFLILESLKILKSRGEKIPYVFFIGDTDTDRRYYNKMRKFIESENLSEYCFFPGVISKEYYYNLLILFDALVVSSKSEGFPLVLTEALKFKLKIISTEAGGISDIIINDYNGIIIDHNANSLANAIIKVQNNAFAEKIAKNGFETYLKYFSFEKNMKKLSEICEE